MIELAEPDGTSTTCMCSAAIALVSTPPWLVMASASSAALSPATVVTISDDVSVKFEVVEGEVAGDVVDVVVGVVVDVVGVAVVGVVVDGVVVDVVASLAGVVVLVVSVAGVDETVVDGVVVVDVVSARAAPAGPAAMTMPASDAAPKERNRVRNLRDVPVDLAAVPTRAKRPR
jgi:hypothetical protein